jgi:hypothetical protein
MSWSPDGAWLIFNSSTGLEALSMKTYRLRPITNEAGDEWPACAPNGRWLAYQRGVEAPNDIVIVPTIDCLTQPNAWGDARYLNGYVPAWRPAWSLDSKMLAFATANGQEKWAVYVTPFDQLTPQPSFTTRTPATLVSQPGCTDPFWVAQGVTGQNVVMYTCDKPTPANHHGLLVAVQGALHPTWQAEQDDGILARDSLCWIPPY